MTKLSIASTNQELNSAHLNSSPNWITFMDMIYKQLFQNEYDFFIFTNWQFHLANWQIAI